MMVWNAKISRRTMLGLIATAPATYTFRSLAAASGRPGAMIGPRSVLERSPMPYITAEGRLCNAGIAWVEGGKQVARLAGNPNHADTQGSLSAPETSAYLSLSDPDRLTRPLRRAGRRDEGKWTEVSWEDALSDIAARVSTVLDQGDPRAICLNMGKDPSGGAWTRFMRSLGSSSIYRSDGLGDLSKRRGMETTWGADIEIPDFAHAKHILVFGSNPYNTFHGFIRPIIAGRVDNGARLTVFDVRTSYTSGLADEWVPVFPGSDGILALSMAQVIVDEGLADTKFIGSHTDARPQDLAEWLRPYTPAVAAVASGVPEQTIRRIAIDFASSGPGAVFSYRGVGAHAGGTDAVRACLLLAVVTGNVERMGGICLPREIHWAEADLAPPQPAVSKTPPMGRHLLPFLIRGGRQPCGVLFNVMANPAYSNPAAGAVRAILADESRIPLLVDFNLYLSETSMLADYVLPDLHYLERTELASGPSLFPWIGLRQPVVPPAEGAMGALSVISGLARRIDPDGRREISRFWQEADPQAWVGRQAESIPELKSGGGLDVLRKNAFWPVYGALDPESGAFLGDDRKPVRPDYEQHRKQGFPTVTGKIHLSPPVWQANPLHQELKVNEFILVACKAHGHVNSLTANNKHLRELNHANSVAINRSSAENLGIGDGDLVRVKSAVGYLVTRAAVTQSIHPRAAAIASSMGHRAFGRVARAMPEATEIGAGADADVTHNLWWRNKGVSPNDIIPVILDPASGGQAWNDVVVSIAPAEPGDEYGDVVADTAAHFKLAQAEIDAYERLRAQPPDNASGNRPRNADRTGGRR